MDTMSELPNVELPAELLPADGRFGSGPSKVRTESVLELSVTGSRYLGTSHRRDGVRSIVGSIRSGLAELFSLPSDYEVILGVGGATAFWDAAVFGLIENRSQHLVFGEFSGKFAAVAESAPHLEPPVIVNAEPGTHPELHFHPAVDVYALTHSETSTGVSMPVSRPPGASGLVAVDATSAAGAMAVDPADFDAYYFSPQKAFGADGGLWISLCSPAAIERIDRIASSSRWIPPFLSLQTAVHNSRKDQTYNTPALATLFILERQIRWMLEMGGLAWAAKRSVTSAQILYDWAEQSDFASPFVADPDSRSTTVVTIDLAEEAPASVVTGVLRANGIVDTESYRKLGRNQMRVATFPNVDPTDVEKLTGAIDFIVARI
jgi:phosphoserine aminotransferase